MACGGAARCRGLVARRRGADTFSARRIRKRQIARKSRATSAERTEQVGLERDRGNRRGFDDHSESGRNARIDGKIPRGSLDTVGCSDMLRNARNCRNCKGFCLSNVESNVSISMLEPRLDSMRDTTTGLNTRRGALWARPEMKPRTLASGMWMANRGSRVTAPGLSPSNPRVAAGSLGSPDSSQRGAPFRSSGAVRSGESRLAFLSFVFPVSLAVMVGPEKA